MNSRQTPMQELTERRPTSWKGEDSAMRACLGVHRDIQLKGPMEVYFRHVQHTIFLLQFLDPISVCLVRLSGVLGIMVQAVHAGGLSCGSLRYEMNLKRRRQISHYQNSTAVCNYYLVRK